MALGLRLLDSHFAILTAVMANSGLCVGVRWCMSAIISSSGLANFVWTIMGSVVLGIRVGLGRVIVVIIVGIVMRIITVVIIVSIILWIVK